MGHADKVEQALKGLGVPGVNGVSLAHLSGHLGRLKPSDMTQRQLLDVYILWLHRRLLNIDSSAAGDLSREVADWHRFMRALAAEDGRILEALRHWKSADQVETGSNSPRLEFAEIELTRLSMPSLKHQTPKLESRFGQMHPDRAMMSLNAAAGIDGGHDGDDDDGSTALAPGSKLTRHDKNPPGQDLSFLTGFNTLPMRKKAKPARNKARHGPKSNGVSKLKGNSKSKLSGQDKPALEFGSTAPVASMNQEYTGPGTVPESYGGAPPEHTKPNRPCGGCGKKNASHTKRCPMKPKPKDEQGNNTSSRDQGSISKTFLARDKGNQQNRDEPLEKLSRLRISPAPSDTRKRRASPPLFPVDKGVWKKKYRTSNPPGETAAMTWLGVQDDGTIIQPSNPNEGRLSYDDDIDPNWPQSSPGRVKEDSSVSANVEVDPSKVLSTQDNKSTAVNPRKLSIPRWKILKEKLLAQRRERFKAGLSVMIREESLKRDLILVVDGVEHYPLNDPFLDEFFRRQDTIWVNKILQTKRLRATDFYEVDDWDSDLESRESGEISDDPVEEQYSTACADVYMGDAEFSPAAAMGGLTGGHQATPRSDDDLAAGNTASGFC
ncbi:hypothetical protein B0J18DRAFT_462304 [Chaetomium sp. MPI-SDFR-AT-0129]|nr:hypothetical protein B0J18DRAFT_462304 [Chaetomium sp. MPI-SDFR-AT-0129]